MSSDLKDPGNAFRAFLNRAEDDGWIAGFKWYSADTFGLLRQKLGGKCPEDFSRTHKRNTDGVWWAAQVEAHHGTSVGIDLEVLISRPILDRPHWITKRLGINRLSTPRAILEEWSAREAAFKAVSPDNAKVTVSQFKRSPPNSLTVFTSVGERSVQIRSQWAGKWVLSLAWRTTN